MPLGLEIRAFCEALFGFTANHNHMRLGSKPVTAISTVFQKFVMLKAQAVLSPYLGVVDWLLRVVDGTCSDALDVKDLGPPCVHAVLSLEFLVKCSEMLAIESLPFCLSSEGRDPPTVSRGLACLVFVVAICVAIDAFDCVYAAAKATWDALSAASTSIMVAWANVEKLSPKFEAVPEGKDILKVLHVPSTTRSSQSMTPIHGDNTA